MYTLSYLLQHSNLPGPRGNLELLYKFAYNADPHVINECLEKITPEVNNSPEEFAGMCGITAYAVKNREHVNDCIFFIKKYASHKSWRIREACAMAIQEILQGNLANVLPSLEVLYMGNHLEKRAVVAGLCEPKLLKDPELNKKIFIILEHITAGLDNIDKLDDGGTALKKALGYGWSVVIASDPAQGKKYFEKLFERSGKHIKWISKENLKKNRLIKMDADWVNYCLERTNA